MIAKIKMIMAAVAMSVAVGVTASGQQGPGGGGGGMRGQGQGQAGGAEMKIMREVMGLNMLGKFVENEQVRTQLGLNDAQVKTIKAKSKEAMDMRQKTAEERSKVVNELSTLLEAERPDVKKIDAKIDQLSELDARMKKDELHIALDIKAALTPEQLEKIKQFAKDRMNKRGGKGGPGGMGNKGMQ